MRSLAETDNAYSSGNHMLGTNIQQGPNQIEDLLVLSCWEFSWLATRRHSLQGWEGWTLKELFGFGAMPTTNIEVETQRPSPIISYQIPFLNG